MLAVTAAAGANGQVLGLAAHQVGAQVTHHAEAAGGSLAGTLVAAAVGGVLSLLGALLGVRYANRAAKERERQSQQAAAALAREQREADLQRERLSELRPIIDEAAHAMSDLWRVLGTIRIAHSRVKYSKPELHMTEEREPSIADFLDAYERLRDAHDRLLLRVQWDDTLHAPVGRALVATQAAWTAVTQEAEHVPLSDDADRKIGVANSEVQRGYRELQETARERFAPGGLVGSQRAVVLILRLRQPPSGPIRNTNAQAEQFLGPLRLARHARVVGPDKDGRVVVRDAESEPGDARARLEADLDAIGDDWRQALELEPPPNSPAG
jgi:hypothetical protein